MRSRLGSALVAASGVLAAVAVGSPLEAGQPSITDLGTLGGTFSRAVTINDRGQITGLSYTASGQGDRKSVV